MLLRFVPSILFSIIATALVLVGLNITSAEVRSSTNYQLQSDSLNFGGGFGTSTNFTLESTAGEVATGLSDSATYSLRAGFQQLQEVFIGLTLSDDDVELLPALGGLTGGTANGSTTATVVTDSPAGYSLTIEAAESPAMRSGVNNILDHATLTTIDFTTSGDARFGYSVFGNDVVSNFFNDGVTCGSGTNVIQECWRGLTTTAYEIATAPGSNHPAGATTTVYFRVGIENGAGVPSGFYIATSTLTALPL